MNLTDKAPAPAPEKHLTRTGIMLVLLPALHAALKTIPGLDLTNADAIRRTLRAVLTVGFKLALDSGMAPQLAAAAAMEALGNELKERADKAAEQGATQPPVTTIC